MKNSKLFRSKKHPVTCMLMAVVDATGVTSEVRDAAKLMGQAHAELIELLACKANYSLIVAKVIEIKINIECRYAREEQEVDNIKGTTKALKRLCELHVAKIPQKFNQYNEFNIQYVKPFSRLDHVLTNLRNGKVYDRDMNWLSEKGLMNTKIETAFFTKKSILAKKKYYKTNDFCDLAKCLQYLRKASLNDSAHKLIMRQDIIARTRHRLSNDCTLLLIECKKIHDKLGNTEQRNEIEQILSERELLAA
nr:hypothetical protein [Vibrio splendidus]MCC4880723.1 hypothetical protein [Vibrio splendidus]